MEARADGFRNRARFVATSGVERRSVARLRSASGTVPLEEFVEARRHSVPVFALGAQDRAVNVPISIADGQRTHAVGLNHGDVFDAIEINVSYAAKRMNLDAIPTDHNEISLAGTRTHEHHNAQTENHDTGYQCGQLVDLAPKPARWFDRPVARQPSNQRDAQTERHEQCRTEPRAPSRRSDSYRGDDEF